MMICPCLTWKSKPGSKIYFRDKAVFSNRLYFLCNIYTQERETEATFAWDVYDRLRGRREVIGSVSTNCFLLKHDTKVWPFPKFTPVMVVSLASKLPGALVGREHVCSFIVKELFVKYHPCCHCLLYQEHQKNTKCAFARKLDIFSQITCYVCPLYVKISLLLWLHNKLHLSDQKTIWIKWFGISLVFI